MHLPVRESKQKILVFLKSQDIRQWYNH